jgi:hypothetical protein
VADGAGPVLDKGEAAETFDEAELEGEMALRGIRLYRYGAD